MVLTVLAGEVKLMPVTCSVLLMYWNSQGNKIGLDSFSFVTGLSESLLQPAAPPYLCFTLKGNRHKFSVCTGTFSRSRPIPKMLHGNLPSLPELASYINLSQVTQGKKKISHDTAKDYFSISGSIKNEAYIRSNSCLSISTG